MIHRGASKITYIIELFALALVIVVVLYFLQFRTTPSSEEMNTSTNQLSTNAALTDSTNTQSLPADSDQDGLSDEEETTLGTNPNLSDSDNDGLIDYDEVKVYKSDPLKSDTDGDGNSDGAEVKNGYSPIDDSKLLDLNREKEKLN